MIGVQELFRTLIKKTDLSDFFVFSVTLSTVYNCCIIVIIVCRRLWVLYALASLGILTALSQSYCLTLLCLWLLSTVT